MGPRIRMTIKLITRSIRDTATEADKGIARVTETNVMRLSFIPNAPGVRLTNIANIEVTAIMTAVRKFIFTLNILNSKKNTKEDVNMFKRPIKIIVKISFLLFLTFIFYTFERSQGGTPSWRPYPTGCCRSAPPPDRSPRCSTNYRHTSNGRSHH